MTSPHISYREIPLTQGQVAMVDEADFVWLNQWKWCALRDPKTGHFYAIRADRSGGKRICIWMHRSILGLHAGDARQGDHVDVFKTLDNRRQNLRIASASQNCMNRRRRADNSSGFKGVTQSGQKWVARIQTAGGRQYLGSFATAQDAHFAYCRAASENHGYFARTT